MDRSIIKGVEYPRCPDAYEMCPIVGFSPFLLRPLGFLEPEVACGTFRAFFVSSGYCLVVVVESGHLAPGEPTPEISSSNCN